MLYRRSEQRKPFRIISRKDLKSLPQIKDLSKRERLAMETVSTVFPFRCNTYVVEELIDWENIPDDPIYQLTFPHRGMLESADFLRMESLVKRGAPPEQIRREANAIRYRMNPQPDGQKEYNVPHLHGKPLPGMQHKYRDTVLFFPSQGQTCHAYCTYCFRWAQFVGLKDLRFMAREAEQLHAYLKAHREVSDILFTGGDPMTMRSSLLRRYIEPLLGPGFEHIEQIRIGTKALSFWPQRFIGDDTDTEDFLRLLEDIRDAGKLPAIMAHFSHPVELSTPQAQQAIRRLQDAGAIIRTQAPLIRHVNDSPQTLVDLWSEQTRLGCVPYYTFVERNTGPKDYFKVPLALALRIFQAAYRQVSGLARTVRGPVMSALPGKVQILGMSEANGERVFVLTMLRGRSPEWERQIWLARYDPYATWLTDLVPPRGETGFFYEKALDAHLQSRLKRTSSQPRRAGGSRF